MVGATLVSSTHGACTISALLHRIVTTYLMWSTDNKSSNVETGRLGAVMSCMETCGSAWVSVDGLELATEFLITDLSINFYREPR